MNGEGEFVVFAIECAAIRVAFEHIVVGIGVKIYIHAFHFVCHSVVEYHLRGVFSVVFRVICHQIGHFGAHFEHAVFVALHAAVFIEHYTALCHIAILIGDIVAAAAVVG